MHVYRASLLEAPHITHGFFGRQGGVSTGVFHSLNVAMKEGEKYPHILENHRRIQTFLHASHLVTLDQIHGKEVLWVEDPWSMDLLPQADAMVTATPGIALGIRTADCVPILLYDAKTPMVAAIHAGWRSLMQNIIQETVACMGRHGADTLHLKAAVGPCIHVENYEVGEDARSLFLSAQPALAHVFLPRGEKYLFDLVQTSTHLLKEAGVTQTEVLPYDTFSRPEDFFSCRHAKQKGEPFGTQMSAIMIDT